MKQVALGYMVPVIRNDPDLTQGGKFKVIQDWFLTK